MKRFFYCCLLMQTFLCTDLHAQQKHFVLSGDPKQPDICLEMNGAKDTIRPGIYLLAGNAIATSAVGGRFRSSGNSVCFTPMYPLAAGERFVIQAIGCADTVITIPSDPTQIPAAATSVAAIYPLADSIPKNILFFHVRFTQAMQESEQAWMKISILDDKGELIPNTWRQRSFWLDSGRLLVLMIHPGRVKSGIHYIGPVFDMGKQYTLVVDSTLKDVYGRSLGASATQTYTVVQDQKERLKISSVSAKVTSGTKEPISVQLNNAADHAAAVAGFSIVGPSEKEVRFTLVQNNTNTLLLQPEQAWQPGRYRIVRAGSFYDCAGNRVNRLFEMKGTETFRDDDKAQTIYVNAE
jgi:hypothetical protein